MKKSIVKVTMGHFLLENNKVWGWRNMFQSTKKCQIKIVKHGKIDTGKQENEHKRFVLEL